MHGGARQGGPRGQKRQWDGGRPQVDLVRLRAREEVMRNDGQPAAMRHCVDMLVHVIDNQREPMVADVVLECVCELPVKTHVYATLVALLSCERPDPVSRLLAFAAAALQRALALGAPEAPRARVLTRFFACAVAPRLVTPASAVSLLAGLVAAATSAAAEASDGSWQPRSDALVASVVEALAFAGGELPEGDPEGTDSLLADIEAYLADRPRKGLPALLRPLGDVTPGTEPPTEAEAAAEADALADAFARVRVCAERRSWDAAGLARARVHGEYRQALERGTPHVLPPLGVPSLERGARPGSLAAALVAFPPRPLWRLLPAERTEGADAGRLASERLVADVLIADSLWAWEEGNRKEGKPHMAAEQLAQGLPLDVQIVPHEALLAETLLAHLLALPRPAFRPVYYAVVEEDLCGDACGISKAFSPAISGCMGAVFRRRGLGAAAVHPAAAAAVAELLASHVATFDLFWPWERWNSVDQQRMAAPQRRFCADVLQRLLRLTYHARLHKSLDKAPGLQALLPPPPGPAHGWVYEGPQDSPTAAAQAARARATLEAVRRKAPPEEVAAALRTGDAAGPPPPDVALEALTAVLLHQGRKTPTHLSTLLLRYAVLIGELQAAAGPGSGAVMLRATAAFWAPQHQQGLVVACDRLLALGLVPPEAVAEWLFDERTAPLYATAESACWTCLHAMLERAAQPARAAAAEAAAAAAAAVDTTAGYNYAAMAAEAAQARYAVSNSAEDDHLAQLAQNAEAQAVQAMEMAQAGAEAAEGAAFALSHQLADFLLQVAVRFAAAVARAAAAAAAAGEAAEVGDAADVAQAVFASAHDAFTVLAARFYGDFGAGAPQLEALLAGLPPLREQVDAHALLPLPTK